MLGCLGRVRHRGGSCTPLWTEGRVVYVTEAREMLLYLGSRCYSIILTNNVIHAVYAMRAVDTWYNEIQ
jgi:hypothetical protein